MQYVVLDGARGQGTEPEYIYIYTCTGSGARVYIYICMYRVRSQSICIYIHVQGPETEGRIRSQNAGLHGTELERRNRKEPHYLKGFAEEGALRHI
jgi:hypothetical protein